MNRLKQIHWLSLLFLFLLLCFISVVPCNNSMGFILNQKKTWPPKGKSKLYEVIRDTGISSMGREKKGNTGGAWKLKLKGQQELILIDIDVDALKGRIITGAVLHLCSASPRSAPLMRVGVSSVACPWEEGSFFWYLPQTGSSCFNQARYKKNNWAYPGSTLMDVVFGKGHTLWKFAEASLPDASGWQSVAVDPDVVAARVAQLSYGFCLSDEVGSQWGCKNGVFHYTLFPNRLVYSREHFNKKPWIEIWTYGEDYIPPEPINSIDFSNTGLPPGQVLVRWKTPVDSGGGKTLGFNVKYQVRNAIKNIPRYLIPMARRPGEEVVMLLQDLPFKPGKAIDLIIQPVDSSGNIGEAYSKRVIAAPKLKLIPDLKADILPFSPGSALPEIQKGLKVCVVDLLDKFDPVSGTMIPSQKNGYKKGNHIFNADKKIIRLQSARNATVCFQLNLSGRAEKISVKYQYPDNSLFDPKIFEFSYVNVSSPGQKNTRKLPDPLIPIKKFVSIPVRGNDGGFFQQKNHSLICEVYVPRKALFGKKNGRLVVSVGGKKLEFKVHLNVWNFTLPDKLSFVPEMNAYGTVNPFKGYEYYRLAHEHRTCINRLPYGWNGKPVFAPVMKNGHFDWEQWDKKIGPLLDGSAFKELPRANEPVDVFYLPFNENWPVNIFKNYTPSYWADEAFSKSYSNDLKNAFKAFAKHFYKKHWLDTIFQFYLNNKLTYRKKNRYTSSPWNFDEPVNTQDFWALRWYGLLWHQSLSTLSTGDLEMWFRADESYSQFDKNLLWGITDIEYLGGNNKQKTRMINDRNTIHGQTYFAEYGSANKIEDSNLKIVLWCLSAWLKGANGVLPWQTIGNRKSWKTADQTALFYPRAGGPVPSVRLKAFMVGQQLVEYLTMVCELYHIPRIVVKKWFNRLVRKNGGKPDIIMIWYMKNRLGNIISNQAPLYKRSWINRVKPQWDIQNLPEPGYVSPATFIESAKPACRNFTP